MGILINLIQIWIIIAGDHPCCGFGYSISSTHQTKSNQLWGMPWISQKLNFESLNFLSNPRLWKLFFFFAQYPPTDKLWTHERSLKYVDWYHFENQIISLSLNCPTKTKHSIFSCQNMLIDLTLKFKEFLCCWIVQQQNVQQQSQ